MSALAGPLCGVVAVKDRHKFVAGAHKLQKQQEAVRESQGV